MSVQFNSQTSSSTSGGEPPNPGSRSAWPPRWALLMHEGFKKGLYSPEEYCNEAWANQAGTDSGSASLQFTNRCIQNVREFRDFCSASQLF